ncbi:hypothetical protein D9M71_681600 [compost metagenome]
MIDCGVEPWYVVIWLLSMPTISETVSFSVIGTPNTTCAAPLVLLYCAVLKSE